MKDTVRRNITLAIVLIIVISATVYLQGLKSQRNLGVSLSALLRGSNANTSVNGSSHSLPQYDSSGHKLAPDFKGISEWLNSEPLTMQQLRGKVVLVDFWTYSCINCIRTLPHLEAWYDKYKSKGLVIVGVHTPEFQFEKDPKNVAHALKMYNITYPVALDNSYATWNAYRNHYWPQHYLIGRNGYIIYDHIGEGGYAETEMRIQELLSQNGSRVGSGIVNLSDNTPTTRNTPEIYLGYSYALPRGENIGNKQGLVRDTALNYTLPSIIRSNTVYLEGEWKSTPDYVEALGSGSVILNFTASSANIVAHSDPPQNITAVTDGIGRTIQVAEPQLYVSYTGNYSAHALVINVNKGFKLNSFTFG